MALRNYTLRPPSVVILEDRRDPYVSWQHHLERTGGQRGGVDLVAPTGTPVYARTAGTMSQIPLDGGAGNSCRFNHRDNPGWKDVFSHLSSYRTPKNPQGLNGFFYEAGDIVAYTGTSGGVAPHLHWHLLDPSNIRRNPWDYFSSGSTAGGGVTPIEEDDFMTDMNEFLNTPAFDGGPTISVMFKRTNELYNAMFFGGPAMEDGGNPVQRSLAQISKNLHQKVQRGDQLLTQIQDNADTNTMVRQILAEGVKVNGELPEADLDGLVAQIVDAMKAIEYKAY